MSVPILREGKVLIASIGSSLLESELLELKKRLLEQVRFFRSRGIIIDVTAADLIDTFTCRVLSEIAQMVRLIGAETVIAGIHPDMAVTLVQLGLDIPGAVIVLDLEEGLLYLARSSKSKRSSPWKRK